MASTIPDSAYAFASVSAAATSSAFAAASAAATASNSEPPLDANQLAAATDALPPLYPEPETEVVSLSFNMFYFSY